MTSRTLIPFVFPGLAIAVVAVFLVVAYGRDKGAQDVTGTTHAEAMLAKAKEIASSYRTFGATKVDREQRQDLGVAPALCAPPEPLEDERPTKPTAPINDTWRLEDRDLPLHGRKIYALYAKDELSFRLAPTNEQPVGQVVVKEAWAPKEVNVGGKPTGDRDMVHYQGKAFVRGESRGLFLLFKVDPATPGTDNGWVYATTAADRTTITACGLLPTCADCHNRGGKDRLFGPIRQ
jgi:hypothetical protein